jgi:O-antigen ligase
MRTLQKGDFFDSKFTRVTAIIAGILIASFAIGVLCGIGLGKYLLMALFFVLIVIFAFTSYSNFLLLLLFLSTNIGLISQRFSIKMDNGSNLVEVRDLIILIAIIVGLFKGRKNLSSALSHPLVWSGCLICGVAFIGALVGFLNGGNPFTIIKELYVMEIWILPLVIAANIRTRPEITRLFFGLLCFGLLIAIGGDIEAATKNAVHLVSNVTVGGVGSAYSAEKLARAIPDANCLIAFTALAYLALAMTSRNNPFSLTRKILYIILSLFILASAFFFQLRTSIAVFCLGALVFFFTFYKVEKVGIKKILMWSVIGVAFLGAAWVLIDVMTDYVGTNVMNVSLQRFKNLIVNIKSDGRIIEYPFAFKVLLEHPLFGLGFGSDFRTFDLIAAYGKPSETIHNIINFFIIKMGIIGLIPFIIFVINILKTYIRNLYLGRKTQNLFGIALGIGLIGLVIQSFVGNVFGLIQSVPIVMVIVGVTVANEQIVTNSLKFAEKQVINEYC